MASTAEVSILIKATDKASGKLKEIGNGMSGLQKVALGLGAAGVTALGSVAVGIVKAAADAAALEPTKITFDNLTKSIGSTADSMLKKLRPATMGVVSDADLMKASNKLVAMGLADTEDKAAALSKMAVTLGTAMGGEATASMENFALMLANQSIPRLDSFGISSSKVRERINELMKADENLTREQAFLTATMEQGEAAMAKVGDVSGSTGIAMQQIRATFKNVTDQVGTAFLPILAKLLVPLGELAQEYGPQVTEWAQKLADWIDEKLIPAFGTLIDFGKNLVGFIKNNWVAILAGLATLLVTVVIPAFVAWAAAAVTAAAATIAAIAPVAVPILAVIAVVALLKKAWDSDFGGIQEKTRAVVNAVKEFFGGLIDKIKTGIAIFTDIFGEFKRLGQNIVDGIKAGLLDAWGKLKGVFETLINLLPEWTKKILGIASESKVFKEIGENIMDGLKSPIVKRRPEIVNALKGLGVNMVASAQGIAAEAMAALQATGAIPTAGGGGGIKRLSGRQVAEVDRPRMGPGGIPPWAYSKGFIPHTSTPIDRGGYGKGFIPPGQQPVQRGGDIVINLDGREIARVVSPYMANELMRSGLART